MLRRFVGIIFCSILGACGSSGSDLPVRSEAQQSGADKLLVMDADNLQLEFGDTLRLDVMSVDDLGRRTRVLDYSVHLDPEDPITFDARQHRLTGTQSMSANAPAQIHSVRATVNARGLSTEIVIQYYPFNRSSVALTLQVPATITANQRAPLQLLGQVDGRSVDLTPAATWSISTHDHLALLETNSGWSLAPYAEGGPTLITASLWGRRASAAVQVGAALANNDNSIAPEPPSAPGTSLPPRVELRRLTHAEYDRIVEQVLGLGTRPTRNFPPDTPGDGFDNVGETLHVSSTQVQLYFDAARSVARDFVHTEGLLFSGDRFTGAPQKDDGVARFAPDALGRLELLLEHAGTYTISMEIDANAAGGLTTALGSRTTTQHNVTAGQSVLRWSTTLSPGAHTMTVRASAANRADIAVRNLLITPPQPLPAQQQIQQARACAASGGDIVRCVDPVLEDLTARLWRRPPSPAEQQALRQGLTKLAQHAVNPEEALEQLVAGLLMSPHFLYRPEAGPLDANGAERWLTDHELAARLAAFLWSAAPDETLLDVAARGQLQNDLELYEQTERLLRSPRSSALADRFAAQWLSTGTLDVHEKDPAVFPEFDATLSDAMQRETRLFFDRLLREDRPFQELLTSTSSFIDRQLAELNQVAAPARDDFEWRDVSSAGRRGILGQASFLTTSSLAHRTSLVKRGEWILGHLLCESPPPPPPGIQPLPEQTETNLTVREQVEQHRANPVCNSCHEVMDNLGFAFENFDAIGRWRTTDNGALIDASGEFEGNAFHSAAELSDFLVQDPRLTQCFVKKMTTYALGRGMQSSDEAALDALRFEWQSGTSGSIGDLAKTIALSSLFRKTTLDTPIAAAPTAPVGGAFASNHDQVYFRGASNQWSKSLMTLVGDHQWSIRVVHQGPKDDGFKFDILGDWTLDYGRSSTAGIAVRDGANIPYPDGFAEYDITFNDDSLRYSVQRTALATPPTPAPTPTAPDYDSLYPSMYLRGAHNGWDLSTPMTLVGDFLWEVIAVHRGPRDDGYKFDVHGDWKINFGASGQNEQAIADGDNFQFDRGFAVYRIRIHEKTLKLAVAKVDEIITWDQQQALNPLPPPPIEPTPVPTQPNPIEPTPVAPPPTSPEPVEPPPIIEPPSVNLPEVNPAIVTGETAYNQQCLVCHGDPLNPGPGQIRLRLDIPETTMAQSIEATMPLINPGNCVGTCATNIAAYLKSLVQ